MQTESAAAHYSKKCPGHRLPGIPGFSRLLGAVGILLVSAGAAVAGTTGTSARPLEEDFQNPPVATRPYVWWHWMGPNFSKTGITKDLEAMKAAGIGGATIFNITSSVQESHAPTENNPWPDQTYRSPKYWEALRHAAAEADRLGLEIGLHNTVGYSTTGGPWIDEERSMQRLVWSEAKAEGGKTVTVKLPAPKLVADEGWGKTGRTISFFKDVAVLAVPAGKDAAAVADVLNLTDKFNPASGELRWNAPAGKWTVYRFCHASTGRPPHPVPDDVLGKVLEADKMSLEQTKFHWETVLAPIQQHLGPYLGKSFRHFLIDSYEAGRQNWTPRFREEFKKRKGYDPLPWLVTLAPAVRNEGKGKPTRNLVSAEATERFNHDYNEVITDLFLDNGWKPARDMVRAAGARLQVEPYGGPVDTVSGAANADLPMVEFWTGRSAPTANPTVVGAGRAAGHTVIGAEAFTGSRASSKWTETPAVLKLSADSIYATGVNRLVLHHWVHQPFDDRYKPAMGMGWWGTHFNRHQTWFEPGKEFFRYLGRVQAMLQRGETPVDILCVGAAAAGGDIITRRAFLTETKIVNGRVTLPSGRSYPVLCIPGSRTLEPAMVKRVGELLEQGAVVAALKPVRSPSLTNYPQCDAEVKALADKIWGAGDKPVTARKVGAGRLFSDLGAAQKALKLEPYARTEGKAPGGVRIYPRRDGAALFFFVANGNSKGNTDFTVSFRVQGLQPELWDAETGTMQDAALWREKNGRTEVELTLGAEKSVFVVSRHKAAAAETHLTALEAPAGCTVTRNAAGQPVIRADSAREGAAVLASGKRVPFSLKPGAAIPVPGPWKVTLAPAVGEAKTLTLDAPASLAASADPAVRYFAGTATYRTTVTLDAAALAGGRRLRLDLGQVCDLARVTVNGRDLGVIWHPPFVRDVTDALRAGENNIEIAVTNTWHNRLVGDEQYPVDFEIGTDRGSNGRALKGYPEWFLKNQPRPSQGRLCFVTWFYHTKDTPLLPAGLLGPVTLAPQAETVVK